MFVAKSTNLSLAPKELPWEELRVQSPDWEPLKVGQKPSFIRHVVAVFSSSFNLFLEPSFNEPASRDHLLHATSSTMEEAPETGALQGPAFRPCSALLRLCLSLLPHLSSPHVVFGVSLICSSGHSPLPVAQLCLKFLCSVLCAF